MSRESDPEDGSSGDHVEYGLDDWSDDPMNEEVDSTTLTSVFGSDEEGDSTTLTSIFGSDDEASSGRYSSEDQGRDLLASVLVGAVVGATVSILLPMIGTALGAGLAGNLRARGELPGAKAGALAGLASTIPGALLSLLVDYVLPLATGSTVVGLGGSDPVRSLLWWLLITILGGVLAAVIGAVAGYVGGRLDPIESAASDALAPSGGTDEETDF